MRQIAVLPSGCQSQKNGNILHFDEDRIFYAATLAVYVINAHTFALEKILSLNPKAIVSISIAPNNADLMVVTSIDCSICIWGIEKEELISRRPMKTQANAFWDPFHEKTCGVVTTNGILELFEWDFEPSTQAFRQVLSVQNESIKFSTAKWNPSVEGQIAIGSKSGSVLVYNKLTKQRAFFQNYEKKTAVVDLQWDRLSSSYLLIAYKFFLSLCDVESGTEIHAFDTQTMEITAVCWLDWTAGNFVTTNARNSNLKVWNASQKQPLDVMKFPGSSGVHAIAMCPGKKRALCACEDGAVSVINLQNGQVEHQSPAGHKETIFDCKISPASPNVFCTASYDSTVKVWGISDFSLHTTLHGNGDVIYCCDWSPKGSMIIASSSSGLITVWDMESGRELARYLHHTKASFCVAWNHQTESMVASTSADKSLVIFNVDFEALHDNSQSMYTGSRKAIRNAHLYHLTPSDISFKFEHPAAVYGCAWSPTNASVLATGCHDGLVRVFNHVMKDPLMYVLRGHTARAFNVAWSPLLNGHLASSSDDKTVIVWNVSLNKSVAELSSTTSGTPASTVTPLRSLMGHSSNVRAISWNHEHRNILLSGAWDSTIRLWDALAGVCLLVMNDHVADVYAIASHPERPFTYLSASRDTTMRVWEIEGLSTLVRQAVVWDGCFDRVIEKSPFDSRSDIAVAQAVSMPNYGIVNKWPACLNEFRLFTSLPAKLFGAHSGVLNASLSQLSKKDDGNRTGMKADAGGETGSLSDGIEKFERLIPEDPKVMASNFYKIFAYFSGASGSMDVWENIVSIFDHSEASTQKPSFNAFSMTRTLRQPHHRQVKHENDVLSAAISEARKLESTKMSVRKMDISGKMEDQLRSTALMYARLGDFAKYCSIMVDIGDWNAALAMAPSVSMAYWKSLSHRYSQVLINESSEKCVPLLLATGKDADAVEFYLRRRDPANAMIVAKMSEQRRDLVPDYSVTLASGSSVTGLTSASLDNQHQSLAERGTRALSLNNITIDSSAWVDLSSPKSDASIVRERTSKEAEDARMVIQVVASNAAKVHMDCACPMLAAAQFLAIGDINTAIHILSCNEEHDLAYAVALCFKMDTAPHIIEMADRCACYKAYDLAIEMLRTVPDGDQEMGLMMSRYCDDQTCSDLCARLGLRSLSSWETRGQEEEAIGSDAEAVVSYVAARNYTRAIRLGLNVLKRLIREPLDLTPAMKKLLRGLKYVNLADLDATLRLQFLLHMLWFTAHDAAAQGIWDTACCMLRCLKLNLSPGGGFPLADRDVQCQQLFFSICAGNREEAVAIAAELTRGQTGSSDLNILADLQQLAELLQHAPSAATTAASSSSSASGEVVRVPLVSAALRNAATNTNIAAATAAMNNNFRFALAGAWGDHSQAIITLVQKLNDALSLPNITNKGLQKKSKNHVNSASTASSTEFSEFFAESVMQGSLLPTSNQHLKLYTSAISQRRIQGRVVSIGEKGSGSYAAVNEAVNWRRVNPFSPLLDGKLIY